MSRSSFRPACVAAAAVLGGVLSGCSRGDAPPSSAKSSASNQPVVRPVFPKLRDDLPAPQINVVMVLVDALRADRMSLYGNDRPTTPNLAAVAKEAVVFDQAHAPAPWTLPSVPSLFTSTFPCEHGVIEDGQRLGPGLITLAERLQRVGYQTAQFIGNGYAGATTGVDRGFEVSERGNGFAGSDLTPWFGQRSDRPFFLYVHNMEPHRPTRTPRRIVTLFGDVERTARRRIAQLCAEYRALVRADWSAGRAPGATDNSPLQDGVLTRLRGYLERHVLLYDAAVRWADEQAGSVVEELKRQGVWEDALFLLLADHGEEFNDHGAYLHSQSVYQELTRVPLLIRFPRGEFGGQRVRHNVSLIDVLPTIFDYLGRPDLAFEARGRSLMPIVRGEQPYDPQELRVTTVRINTKRYYKPWAETRGNINVALRMGDFKGVYNVDLDRLELYDLASDPGETHDLAAAPEHAETARRMHDYAAEWYQQCAASRKETLGGGLKSLDPQTLRELAKLGYIDLPDAQKSPQDEEANEPRPQRAPRGKTESERP